MDDSAELAALEARIRALLPETYEGSYEEVQPIPMRSAGLRFDENGKVAWNEMWGSFCDLAMAGGPPHKGTLLEPATEPEIAAQPERYRAVVGEISRGVTMVADLPAQVSPIPGWVRVTCLSEGMVGWLLRAIVMENVAARARGRAIDVPASPHFRLEKEVKNVVTVMAKTCHYWLGHTSPTRQRAIGRLLAEIAEEAPLVEPAAAGEAGASAESQEPAFARMAETVRCETGLQPSSYRYTGWFGVECPSVRAAIWMMRAVVVSNVLSRREGTVLFVPVNSVQDPEGARAASAVIRTHRLARLKRVL
jgi:hypothetical protein